VEERLHRGCMRLLVLRRLIFGKVNLLSYFNFGACSPWLESGDPISTIKHHFFVRDSPSLPTQGIISLKIVNFTEKHLARKLQLAVNRCSALLDSFECISRTHSVLLWTLAFSLYTPKVAYNLLAENNLFSIRPFTRWTWIAGIVQGYNIIQIFHGIPKILQENDMKVNRKFCRMYSNLF